MTAECFQRREAALAEMRDLNVQDFIVSAECHRQLDDIEGKTSIINPFAAPRRIYPTV